MTRTNRDIKNYKIWYNKIMKIKNISRTELKNIINDYDDFIESCEEGNRYSGSDFIILKCGDEVYNVVE